MLAGSAAVLLLLTNNWATRDLRRGNGDDYGSTRENVPWHEHPDSRFQLAIAVVLVVSILFAALFWTASNPEDADGDAARESGQQEPRGVA